MILALIGAILIIWSLWAGIGTYENNRAALFHGPVGTFVSLGVVIIGYCLIVYGLNISIRNALIFVGVVSVIIIYAQFHEINPENKTDSQLWKLWDAHRKHGLDEHGFTDKGIGYKNKNFQKIVDEMNKRGLFHPDEMIKELERNSSNQIKTK